MQIFPFSQEEIRLFRELNKHRVPYIIVGLAAAALQGAPIVTKDVDIWFKDLNNKKLQSIFKKCGIVYIPSIELNPPAVTGKGINLLDLVTHVHGIKSFDEEIRSSIKVKIGPITLRILPLEKIIKSKQVLKRQRDLLVLPILKNTLISKKGFWK